MLSFIIGLFHKARIHIEETVWRKNLRLTVLNFLSIVNRRGIPLPSALYTYFNSPDADPDLEDLADERFLSKYLVPENGKSLVDCGAGLGMWSLFVAEKGNRVYAFEPSPKAYRILVRRTKNYPNIQAFPYALGEKDAVGRLGLVAFSTVGTLDREVKNLHGGETIDIAIRSLDSLSLSEIGVIKIDTEGYEIPILLGAQKTIEREKPRLVIEVHKETGKAARTFKEELERITAVLGNFGYAWIDRYRYVGLHAVQPFVIAYPNVTV